MSNIMIDKCMKEFESAVLTDGMYSTKHLLLKKDANGEYINLYTIYAYLAWRACWNLNMSPA